MIKEIFYFVTKSSIILGCITYLLKVLFTQLLKKDIEKFKYDLKESLVRNEITFKNLQERRIDILAKIYSLLVDSIYTVEKYCSINQKLEDKIGKDYDSAITTLIEFFKYFDKNRIFISEELCTIIDSTIKELRDITENLYCNTQIAITSKNKNNIDAYKIWFDNWENFKNKKNPTLKKKLENEIRKLIGVIEK